MKNNREKGYLIRLLDPKKTTELVQAVARDVHGESHADSLKYYSRGGALVRTNQGVAYLCTEGVGWFVDKETDQIEVQYYTGLGYGFVDVSYTKLLECLSDETAELGDFIRTFGSRLDVNFSLWKEAMRGISQEWSK